jgi:ubiquinone/menaquinone biosynthesis C-methylase UbiE
MKTLEESIAAAMDAQQDTAIVPFLPYILQDFWELGTPPEIVINLVQKHFDSTLRHFDTSTTLSDRKLCASQAQCDASLTNLQILDLGCGKGAISIKLAEVLKCNCYGLDGFSEFIEVSKEKAKEYGVDTLCRFEVGDVREKIQELDKFDVIILGATGPIFDDYFTALTTLSKHLTDEGIIIIEEGYIDDSSAFQHPPYLSRKELFKQFEQAGMELIDETVGQYSDFYDSAKDMENIVIRCNELKAKYPEKSSLFENYAQNQASEYDALENEMIGSSMVLRTRQKKSGN